MQPSELNILQRTLRKTRFLEGYLRTSFWGQLKRKRYVDLKSFVVFIGYPRSGHTLIAALLDAHPNILISIEWGALMHLKLGYRKNAMLYAIEKHSRLFTRHLSNVWTGYSYRVEGQWQGRSDCIRVMGDKLAGQTSKILKLHPELLSELKEVLKGIEIKIIHVVRNPFDTIAAISYRALEKRSGNDEKPDLQGFSQKYFERAEVVRKLKTEGEYPIFDLYHEDFIGDPRGQLKELLKFLGVSFDEAFVENCSKIVYPSPHQRRRDYDWPDDLIREIQAKINEFDFFSRYDFDH